MASVAVLLGVREEEQVQQVDVLHQRDAELVQQDHQPLLDVRRVYFVLARVQDLQQGSQEGLVHQQLVPAVADQLFVQLELFKPDGVAVSGRRSFIL